MSRRKTGALDPYVYEGLRARGIPHTAARGAAAGVEAESRSDPNSRGGYKGRTIGYGQWLGPRRAAILAKYGPNPTPDQQLDFLAWELKGGDPGGKHVLSAKTEDAALGAYISKFMRPALGAETDGDMRRGRKALGLPPGPRTPTPSPSRLTGAGTIAATITPPTLDEIMGRTPDELFGTTEQALREERRKPKAPNPTEGELVTSALTGGDGIKFAPIDLRGARPDDEAVAQAERVEQEAQGVTRWDRFKAAYSENLVVKLVEAVGRDEEEFDPEFTARYAKNWQSIETFAESDDEVSALREAQSDLHLEHIKTQLQQERQRTKIINTGRSPMTVRLVAGVLDPVGWVAGFGVGKGAQMMGFGARELFIAGRPLAGIASAGAEGTVGNLAFTAGLDASGEYVSPTEYKLSALAGLVIGTTLGGTLSKYGANKQLDNELLVARQARQDHDTAVRAEVSQELGPDAAPEAIEAGVRERVTKDYRDVLEYSLADVPADQRILVAEDILTTNDKVKAASSAEHDLAAISDEAERDMVAEIVARSERIVSANPIDAARLQTILAKVGQEANATRMLQSNSPVAKALALTLLENGQGAGGRRRTAAIAMAQQERLYNEALSGYDGLMQTFRRQRGGSRSVDFWNGKYRNEYNGRVMAEIEARGNRAGYAIGQRADPDPLVVQGADMFENGMDRMRLSQQHVGTVGSARLGDTSVGYAPHRLDPRKVLALTTTQSKNVRAVLAAQFRETEGWDAAFSDKLAAKYLERAVDTASGRYQVPFNLHSPEAGEIVRDALEAMQMGRDEIEQLMGKFSRGGASHTKQRLRLDLSADIGDGMKLQDLFVTDLPALYRAYSRRVSGEVALAQYGIMGKKGLALASKAMTATGATPDDIRAFDQIASEFLNTPFGQHNHAWLDNARIMTSSARLGGMGFTQTAEFGNAIFPLGAQATTKAIASMPRLTAEVRAMAAGAPPQNSILQSLDRLGGQNGLEEYHVTRMFDVPDNTIQLYGPETMGVMSRASRSTGQTMMILSGHRMIMSGQIRGMSEQIVRKAVKYAKSGKADEALDDMGISPRLRDAIKADLDNIATFDKHGELLTLDLFKGKALKPADVAEIAQAVERGAGQIIQRTYIGERGHWAHDGFLKTLLQFRTFSLTSIEKQWGRNLGNYGALRSFTALMVASSFAVPIHMARVGIAAQGKKEGKDRDEYLERNLNPLALARATQNYASASGMFGDVMDVGAGFASNYGGDFGQKFGDAYGVRGGRTDGLIGGVIAPSAGWINDLYTGVAKGDLDKLVHALPGSNLPYVTPFLNPALRAVEEEETAP